MIILQIVAQVHAVYQTIIFQPYKTVAFIHRVYQNCTIGTLKHTAEMIILKFHMTILSMEL